MITRRLSFTTPLRLVALTLSLPDPNLSSTSPDGPGVQAIVLEAGDGVGPFGANRIGEPSMVSIASAIGNAVCNAIGFRILDLPLTPEKIVKVLKRRWCFASLLSPCRCKAL